MSPLTSNNVIFEGPVRRDALPLLWQSVEGPKEYATIWVEEEPKTVPVVVRSEKDCQLPFPLPAGVARFTDQSVLIHRKAFTDLEPGSYKMRLRVQSMGRTWDSQTYILSVPRPDIKNDQFESDPLLWRLQQCFKGKEKKGESRRRTGRGHGGPPSTRL